MEHIWKIVAIIILFLLIPRWLWSQKTKPKLAQLKCKNGGVPGVLPYTLTELIQNCNQHFSSSLAKEPVFIEADNPALYDYPYLYLPVSEEMNFTAEEVESLREYLSAGGFLHINGDRTIAVDREMQRIFPEGQWEEIPAEHPTLSSQTADFPSLSSEISALGIIKEDRLTILLTSSTNRQQALLMGRNAVAFALSH